MCPWPSTALPWSQFQESWWVSTHSCNTSTGRLLQADPCSWLHHCACTEIKSYLLYATPQTVGRYRKCKVQARQKILRHSLFFQNHAEDSAFYDVTSGSVAGLLCFFYFVSSCAHSSTCTPCCSNKAYCIWWGSNYIGLDSQRETRFFPGSFSWRLPLALPWCSALRLLWKLLCGSVRVTT